MSFQLCLNPNIKISFWNFFFFSIAVTLLSTQIFSLSHMQHGNTNTHSIYLFIYYKKKTQSKKSFKRDLRID